MAYVYRHIRLDKNEPFYIGISGRKDNYKRAYSIRDRNIYWERIVAKTKYEVQIILDDLTWDEVCEKEKEFILLYGRRDLGKGILVNLTDGGGGTMNDKMSEEISIKMSKAQLGNKKYLLRTTPQEEINKKISIANKGRIVTEEQKQKIRNYFKINGHPSLGKKTSDETKEKIAASRRIKILQFDLDNNFIKEWDSILDAKKQGYCNVAIWRCLKGIYKHHKKSFWKYKN
jgi:hypothetical protein